MLRVETGRKSAGFTLIELMIVVVIVAVLASIAIPSYETQIRKSRRTDAKTAVLDLAGREEKYFSLNNTYTTSPASLGYVAATNTGAAFPQTVGSGYYQIFVCIGTAVGSSSSTTACTATNTTASGTSYVVAAIPVSGSSQTSDASCQYFATDNTGTQFSSNTVGIGTSTASTCWQ